MDGKALLGLVEMVEDCDLKLSRCEDGSESFRRNYKNREHWLQLLKFNFGLDRQQVYDVVKTRRENA